MEDYKIGAALINCFYSTLTSDKDDCDISARMKENVSLNNNLDKYFLEFKKAKFEKINGYNIEDFPRYSIENIKKFITFGSFQIKSSFSYLAEHMKEIGYYDIFINESNNKYEDRKVLLAKIQSRHIKRTEYHVVIEYFPHSSNEKDINWRCSCKNGKRTVGCCSHCTSVIYFLSCGKYEKELRKPGERLNNILKNVKINEENDTSDDEFDLTKNNLKNLPKIKRDISSSSIEIVGKKSKANGFYNSEVELHDILKRFESILPEWGGHK